MKKIIIIFLSIIMCVGCSNKESNNLESIISSGEYIILDVRSEDEYNNGHVVGAINIPVDKIENEIQFDKDKTIIVYCQSGKRSKLAKEILEELNYNVYDLGAYDRITLEKES